MGATDNEGTLLIIVGLASFLLGIFVRGLWRPKGVREIMALVDADGNGRIDDDEIDQAVRAILTAQQMKFGEMERHIRSNHWWAKVWHATGFVFFIGWCA